MTTGNFLSKIESSLAGNTFAKLSLGHYTGPESDLKKIDIRKILVKREEKLSFTYHYKTRDIVKNFYPPEAIEKIKSFLADFKTARLLTTKFDLALESGKIKKSPPSQKAPPAPAHDRPKNRLLSTPGKPWLHALALTDEQGNIYKNAQDKFRQIDKYVEILSSLLKDIPPEKTARIVDMGAGKGYLTFALYDHLAGKMKTPPRITGVKSRADLVRFCNETAAASNFSNLDFVEGSIESFDAGGTNILIALHACDTATDDAIAKGIKAGAELIVVAPCCHKQIRREMEKSKAENALTPLTRHGIFLERQAEMVTDTLRALLLEYHGYHVKVFEFISGEHTAKNVMITATRTTKSKNPQTLQKINEIKGFFGISSYALEEKIHL